MQPEALVRQPCNRKALWSVTGVEEYHGLLIGWVQVGQIGNLVRQAHDDQAGYLVGSGVEELEAGHDVTFGPQPEERRAVANL